jgi:hypothetical protein
MRITMVIAAMSSCVAPNPGDIPASPARLIAGGPPPTGPKPIGGVAFPNAVPDIYATMDEGSARQQTCMDQYIANAQTESNGKLSWDEYYAKCDDRLIR